MNFNEFTKLMIQYWKYEIKKVILLKVNDKLITKYFAFLSKKKPP